jgi:hypothetical protein
VSIHTESVTKGGDNRLCSLFALYRDSGFYSLDADVSDHFW